MKVNRRNFLQVSLAGLAAIALPISLIDGGVIHPRYKVMSQGGALTCHDIWPGMKLFLKPETVAIIEARKTFSTVYEYNTPIGKASNGDQEYVREVNLVRYVAVTTDTIEEGVEKLADIVEQVNAKWKIQATLTPGIALQLTQIGIGPGKWLSCSYLVLDFNHPNTSKMKWDDPRKRVYYEKLEKEFDNWQWSLKEGGMPKYSGKTRDYHKKSEEYHSNTLKRSLSKVGKGNFKTGRTWTKRELKV